MKLSEIFKEAYGSMSGNWLKAPIMVLIYFAISVVASIISAIPCLGALLSVPINIGIIVISVPLVYGLTSSFLDLRRNKEIGYVEYFKVGFANFKRSWCVQGNVLKKLWVYLLVYVLLCIALIVVMVIMGVSVFATSTSYGTASISTSVLSIVSIVFLVVICIALVVVVVLLTIKGLYYSLSVFTAIDNPDMTPLEAVNLSEKQMNGNRAKYFLSQLPMCIPVIIFFIICLVLGIFVVLLGLPEVVISLLSFVLSIVFCIAMAWPTAYIYMVQTVFYEKIAGVNKSQITVESDDVKEEGSEENN